MKLLWMHQVLYTRSDLPLRPKVPLQRLEFTFINFAKPTIHWPALYLSSPPHPESPLVLITEPSVFSFSQPSASFDHFTCFTCVAFSVLGSTTQNKNSLACISTAFTRLGKKDKGSTTLQWYQKNRFNQYRSPIFMVQPPIFRSDPIFKIIYNSLCSPHLHRVWFNLKKKQKNNHWFKII